MPRLRRREYRVRIGPCVLEGRRPVAARLEPALFWRAEEVPWVDHERREPAATQEAGGNGFRSVFHTVDGRPMHARVANRPHAGLPRAQVVLVHGLGLSGEYMMPVARELARRYETWVPDLPGFGLSAKPRWPLDVAGLGDALAGWIGAAGLERPVLLGNSFWVPDHGGDGRTPQIGRFGPRPTGPDHAAG